MGHCEDLFTFQSPKTSLTGKLPCLLKLPPTNPEWSASFFGLSLPSAWVGVSLHTNTTTVGGINRIPLNYSWVKQTKIGRGLSWPVWLSWLSTILQNERLVTSLIPSQGMCLGCLPGWGCIREATSQYFLHWCFSPSLSPSLPLILKLINKI